MKLPYEELKNHPLIEKFRRREDGTYNRNKPHICSFFVKGTCTRGDECPYRHEMPDPEAQEDQANRDQNIKNRYYGKNDPLTSKIEEKVLGKVPAPPSNQKIKTLLVHNCQSLKESDLKRTFEKIGEIDLIELKDKIAMITFNTREIAEKAMSLHYGSLIINVRVLNRIQI